jgi:hypothetical protein
LGGKHFPEVVKNLEMSLFADYIKFDPQNFWLLYIICFEYLFFNSIS